MAQSAARRWTMRAAPILVVAGTLALMIGTEPHLAMAWDEGYTLGREARVRAWFRAVRDPQAFAKTWVPPSKATELVEDKRTPPRAAEIDSHSKLFSADVIAWFWPFGREEPHGHPPFYAIVGVLGDWVVPSWSELPRSRFGPMLVFSVTAGAIFWVFVRRSGFWPAWLATGAWIFQPQLFALGHYAGYDAILASLWVGAILAFSRAVGPRNSSSPTLTAGGQLPPGISWFAVIAFGILCGWAADTKLTGWFLPLPFLAWTIVTRSRSGFLTLVVGGLIALLTLYLFNPPWWTDWLGGPYRFFHSNLSREKTIRIPVMFLGRIHLTPVESLPPYNTIVWTVIATPLGFLALALIGSIRAVRDRASSDPLAILALGHWVFLLILRSLPHTPGHDGVRQFLPAFGCLALMSGIGSAWIVERWRTGGKVMIALAISEGLASVLVMMPVPLSYFSPIVGGLPGATRIGMEPTYYWDALSASALDRLAKLTPPGRTVCFATNPSSWLYLKRTGAMRFPVYPLDRNEPAFYVVQNRRGSLSEIDLRLIREIGPQHVLVEKFGVPLIWAFPARDFLRLQTASTSPTTQGLSP